MTKKAIEQSLEIPAIDSVIKTTEKALKQKKDKEFYDLLQETFPFHEKLLAEIEKASKFGLDSCCIKDVPINVANELGRQYLEAKYEYKIDGTNFILIWAKK